MNIYLDIWGTLYKTASSIEDREQLLDYILEKCPDSTYWLTTYCQYGINRAEDVLAREFPPEFAHKVAERVQVAEWETLKTEGIDFSRPFLWLDDNCAVAEREALVRKGAEQNYIAMNPFDPESARRALDQIRARIEKI